MESTNVSGREAELIDAISDRDMIFFGPTDIQHFLGINPRNSYQLLARMKKKGLIVHIERGKYVLRKRWEELDIEVFASNLVSPAYLAFWSALHFHKMTEQVPKKVFVATTRRTKNREIRGNEVRFVSIRKELMFGYERLGETIVSTPEKTIVDSLIFPEYSSLPIVNHALRDSNIDIDTLVSHCISIGSGALASRLGYLLEYNDLLKRREEIREQISSYTKLSPQGEKANPNPVWKLYINTDIE